MFNKDIDTYRRRHLAVAEFIDAWRVIPRMVVGLYIWLVIYTILWYHDLKPYMLEGCDIEKLGGSCLIQIPTTQHVAALTAVTGLGVAIFGFYTSTSRKWNGFTSWKKLTDSTSE